LANTCGLCRVLWALLIRQRSTLHGALAQREGSMRAYHGYVVEAFKRDFTPVLLLIHLAGVCGYW
jgi:hypothetical protein